MKSKIFKSYGVLAHEKEPVYTFRRSASEIYDTLTVEIPHVAGVNDNDEPLLELDGVTYRLGDVLTNIGEKPAISWINGTMYRHELLQITD